MTIFNIKLEAKYKDNYFPKQPSSQPSIPYGRWQLCIIKEAKKYLYDQNAIIEFDDSNFRIIPHGVIISAYRFQKEFCLENTKNSSVIRLWE